MSSLSETYGEADPVAEGGGASVAQDKELLRKAQAGDRAAYGQIVIAYQDRIYNAMRRMVGDAEEAKDLTQEAFTRGLIKLDTFRGESAPYTWLFRIAVNLAISQLRKVHRRRTFSLESGGSIGNDQASGLIGQMAQASGDTPAAVAERREEGERILGALGKLDAEYRAILVMRDIEGLDYMQMADVLGLPMGTLKSRLFRARLALRDEMRNYRQGKNE